MKFEKILITQQNMIGDAVISTGFVKAVRETFPKSKIAYMVLPEAANLVKLPFIDEIVPYKKGMPILPVIKKIWRYDVALCLDFKYKSALLPFLAMIPVRAGLTHKRKLFMSNSIALDEVESEQIYFNNYMAQVIEKCIGIKLQGDLTKLYVADATDAEKIAVDKILPRSEKLTIAIAPFTSTLIKNLPIETYKAVMQKLRTTENCRFVLIGGKADAQKNFYFAEDDIDLRGKTTLTEMAEVLRRADFLFSGCSAPLHIAAAVKTPTLAFYGPTSPLKWAPKNFCKYIYQKQECSPCDRVGHGKFCNMNNICMKSIEVEEILAAFESLKAI